MLGITGEFQSGIDAAIEGHGQFEGKALFFREGKLGILDWATEVFSLEPIESLRLPADFTDGIDAGLNGRLSRAHYAYFIKGDQYIRYDWRTMRVSDATPPYPDHINRMNRGRPWPGLGISQPVATEMRTLAIKLVFKGTGFDVPIPDLRIPFSVVGCDISTGPPWNAFTTASNTGITGSGYIDTGEVNLGDVGAPRSHRFKHLHAQQVHVKLEPTSVFAGSGAAKVTLTVIPSSGNPGPADQVVYMASACKGYVIAAGPIEFTAEFLQR
jgi:hypothetical protein